MSQLITPDARRRLQQRYEEAKLLAAVKQPDFKRVHELLAECVRADPGNILYLGAMLANLRRRGVTRGWWKRWIALRRSGGAVETAAADSPAGKVLRTEHSVLGGAADALWNSSSDPVLYCRLAEAAGACDFDEAELFYLHAALELSPDDSETMKLLARALTRQGRFAEALNSWAAIPESATDEEVRQAIKDLHVEDLLQAEVELASAQAAAGADLSILQRREELRIARSVQQVAIAKRRAEYDSHPKAKSLVTRLEAEQTRVEIEILNVRCERLPADWSVRLELARRLKQAGNFSGAIQRLDEAACLRPSETRILLELGECWQHLRQFAKAIAFYRQAIAMEDSHRDQDAVREAVILAHYRAGVLLAAMGDQSAAADHLMAVVSANPEFKDARERLDNLGVN